MKKNKLLVILILLISLLSYDYLSYKYYKKSVIEFKNQNETYRSLLNQFFINNKRYPNSIEELFLDISQNSISSKEMYTDPFIDKLSSAKDKLLVFIPISANFSNEQDKGILISTGIDGTINTEFNSYKDFDSIPLYDSSINKNYFPGKYFFNKTFGKKDYLVCQFDFNDFLEQQVLFDINDVYIDILRGILNGKIIGLRNLFIEEITFNSTNEVMLHSEGFKLEIILHSDYEGTLINPNDTINIVGILDTISSENKYLKLINCRLVNY